MTTTTGVLPSKLLLLAVLVPLLAAAQDNDGAGQTRSGGLRCRGAAGAPLRLQLQPGKSAMLPLTGRIAGRSIGNPGVAQAVLAAPDTLYVAGVAIGSTNMVVQLASGICQLVDIDVALDAAGLQGALAALLPQEKDVRVTAAADSLVLSGTVSDGPTLAQVVELAHAYVRRPVPQLATPGAPPAGTAAAAAGPAETAQGPRVVNLLAVTAPQQVMLEVKIAEVSKTLLDKLETSVLLKTGGSWTATLLSNFLSGVAKGHLDLTSKSGKGVMIDAERQDSLVRILAEPTLVAVSGQEGSFLAGGKILIPVAQDDRRVTLEEKEFGVGLRFTPTVLSGGRINLKVAPEVSELSREGVGIRAAGLSGPAILPLVTTRRSSTTVQLNDGQSFAIGGLIRNNQNTDIKGLPLLSEIPVLGALFRSTDFLHERTELLFLITARLVQPQQPGQALPTGDMAPPGRASLFLGAHPAGGQP
ncbi:type II and III secretion system protein family protein [Duganella sp. FT92W]|uniref:Type II and III secretion system protein family protein n=1 Tax=Pseudoduganella rivuli TaxID=2666085 RepID=A0A7X2IJM8_9BURK|nr:type II and III secretion system protein family protein [Pseudoduganella rivuli]MRV71066.1 type II and III secretion system protein family protein [Pseudoduganella rivuli]